MKVASNVEPTNDCDEDMDTSMCASREDGEGHAHVNFMPALPMLSGDDHV